MFIRLKPVFCALCMLIVTGKIAAADLPAKWSVNSPDGHITITIERKKLGSPYSAGNNLYYSVLLKDKMKINKEVLGPSPLGVEMSEKTMNFLDGLTFVGQIDRTINEKYPMISGKKSLHHNNANEKTLVFKNQHGRMGHLIFRAYNDGIAYRYHFPGKGDCEIIAEASGFKLDERCVGWLQDYRTDYQGYYLKKTPRDSIKSDIAFPALFRTPDGICILITEAAVYGDYAGSRLTGSFEKPAIFTVKFPQEKLVNKLPWTTPWRVAIIGENMGTIVESVLVDNLNPPCELDDTSWIKPGRVSLAWMTDHNSGDDIKTLKSFIDLSADMGWKWSEINIAMIGCPENLEGCEDWMDNPEVPELLEYAKNKNVDIYGWSNWKDLKTPQQREKVFGPYNKLGIKGIKADFICDDSQTAFKWRDEFIRDCAERKLMISFHGATLPRGQRRRWPHIMTWEAILAEEWYDLPNAKDPCPPPTPEHNCTVPFTRNVVGPMDYTPTVFSFPNSKTTDAHELALSVIFESGWQCLSDSPQSYNKSPAKPFLKDVPAAWDDIHFIKGFPGYFCSLARRKGNDWFIAAINAGRPLKLQFWVDFLKPGKYSVTLYKDGDNPNDIVTEQVTLDTNELFEIMVPPNGGFAMKIPNSYR